MSYEQRRRFLWILFLIGLGLVAVAANATTLMHLRFQDLVSYSSAIARVRCLGSDVRMEAGELWTDTRFLVLDTQKGVLPSHILVRQPGGAMRNIHSRVEGAAEFRPGEEVYVFLWGRPGHIFNLVGWTQGTFRIHRNPRTGTETVTQDSAEIPAYDPEAQAFTKSGVRNLDVHVFLERVQRETFRALR